MIDRDKIVQIALAEVGATSGAKYTKKFNELTGMGLPLDCSWCATFVTYVNVAAGVTPEECLYFKGCATAVDWFKSKGRFKPREATPAAGDLIFFEWNPDSTGASGDDGADHVGIVRYTSNGLVYTVEGNSGANHKADIWAYSISNPKILGYGTYEETGSEKSDVYYSVTNKGRRLSTIINAGSTASIMGYAGNYGIPIDSLQVEVPGRTVKIRVLSDVSQSGVEYISAIQLAVDKGVLRYRVHNIGRKENDWCNWIAGRQDYGSFHIDSGYAGNIGKAIDCIQIECTE